MKATAQMGRLTAQQVEAWAAILHGYCGNNEILRSAVEGLCDLALQALKSEPNAAVSVGPTCPSFVCLTPKGCALYGCKMQPPPPERP